MSVRVSITDGPLGPPPVVEHDARAGALLRFEGIVRDEEAGSPIAGLDYEVYEPMARRMLEHLGEEVRIRHGVKTVIVEHSRGRVRVGECSFRLTILAAHRTEALAATGEFIDRLKRDVPIWKRAVREAG